MPIRAIKMGNILASFFEKKDRDEDSAWKLQNEEAENNCVFHLINFAMKGEWLEKYNNIENEAKYEEYIEREIQKFLYKCNKDEGKCITKVEYGRWKYKIQCKIEGKPPEQCSRDPRPDEQVLAEYKDTNLNIFKEHRALWDLEQRGPVGETPLHLCYLLNTPDHNQIAKVLLKLYPKLSLDVYEGDEYFGESALHIAIVRGNLEAVILLVKSGADIHQRATGNFFLPSDMKDGNSETYQGDAYYGEYPLSFAASFGFKAIYDFLIQEGADPLKQDSFGNTVLHMIVINNTPGMYAHAVRHHTRRKANPNIMNKQNLTPLTLSCKLGRGEIFQEILEEMSTTVWDFGNVTCSVFPLTNIDTISPVGKTNETCALKYIIDGETEEHLDMLKMDVIERLLQEKWKTFAKKRFIQTFIVAVIHLIFLSVAVYLRPVDRLLSRHDTIDIVRYVFEVLTCISCTGHVIIEVVEITRLIRGGLGVVKDLKKAPAKSLFVICNILILLCIPCRLINMNDNYPKAQIAEETLLVIAIPGSWTFVMFFASFNGGLGTYVHLIQRMFLKDFLSFSSIYITFLLIFDPAFYFLFRDIDSEVETFLTPHGSLMSLIRMTFGDFEYQDFHDSHYSELTKLVFILFMFLVPILLMNMLIAMMANTYNLVIEKSEKEWWRQKAQIIVVLERAFESKKLLKYQTVYGVPIAPPKDFDDTQTRNESMSAETVKTEETNLDESTDESPKKRRRNRSVDEEACLHELSQEKEKTSKKTEQSQTVQHVALMVVRSKARSKAKTAKLAFNNWKKLYIGVKRAIKQHKASGKTGEVFENTTFLNIYNNEPVSHGSWYEDEYFEEDRPLSALSTKNITNVVSQLDWQWEAKGSKTAKENIPEESAPVSEELHGSKQKLVSEARLKSRQDSTGSQKLSRSGSVPSRQDSAGSQKLAWTEVGSEQEKLIKKD